MTQVLCDEYFGGCPHCGSASWANVGKVHWCYCPQHEVRWCIGENVLSSWQHENEEIWQKNIDMLDAFIEVEPLEEGQPIPMSAEARQAVDDLFRRIGAA
jgi:hypothetical protein